MVDRQTVVLVQDALQPYLSPLGPEQAVLDLAAGADAVYYPPGFDMSRVTALDASSVALSLNPSGHKDQADFRAPLNYPDNTFGLVVCAFGVRYTRYQEHLVAECLRVAAPQSYTVFVDFPDAEDPTAVREFDAVCLQTYAQSLGHPAYVRTLRARTQRDYQLDLLSIRK
jgi:ubiquinone/menaquinone biosynthesis C-methylase UbiE